MENERLFSMYTVGTWIIKQGHENDFIREWKSFAVWMSKNLKGVGKGYLLQDGQNPLRFISFGPWKDMSTIQQWRESNEFKTFVGKVMPFCEDFQPNTLRIAATSE